LISIQKIQKIFLEFFKDVVK